MIRIILCWSNFLLKFETFQSVVGMDVSKMSALFPKPVMAESKVEALKKKQMINKYSLGMHPI